MAVLRHLGFAWICVALTAAGDHARAQTADAAAGTAAELVLSAVGLIDVPYGYSGGDPATGLDCSGLVALAARNALGLQLPRHAEGISRAGVPVEREQLQPGDLVFFNTLGRRFSHVGVYLGDSQFVHAPARSGRVRIESLSQPYWRTRFNGARRLVPDEEMAPAGAAGEVHAEADRSGVPFHGPDRP